MKKPLFTINIYDKKTKDVFLQFMDLNFLKTYTSAIRLLLTQNNNLKSENKKLNSLIKTYEIKNKYKKS